MAHNSQQIARVLQMVLRATRGRVGTRWLVVLMVLLGGYLFAEPTLEARFGIDLPGVHTPGGTTTAEVDTPASTPSSPKNGPPSRKTTRSEQTTQSSPPVDNSNTDGTTLEEVLEEVGRDTYKSNSGLIFGRGSVHGHRLKHLMSHARDDADRPGQHGVFDESDTARLIRLIDEVYLQALSGKNTKKQVEGRRAVYTVDLRRRVGYIGGQSGNRRNHPAAKHVRLVVDGDRFITAFPIRP